MNTETIIALAICSAVISGGFGLLAGEREGRRIEGLLMGTLLGPVGLLLFCGMGRAMRECESCCGQAPVDARRCWHCGAELKPLEESEKGAVGKQQEILAQAKRRWEREGKQA